MGDGPGRGSGRVPHYVRRACGGGGGGGMGDVGRGHTAPRVAGLGVGSGGAGLKWGGESILKHVVEEYSEFPTQPTVPIQKCSTGSQRDTSAMSPSI